MKIKAWFIRKEQQKAGRYDLYIDIDSRDEKGCEMEDSDGYYDVRGKIISETEKAIKVQLSTGDVVGSGRGWETWIPKSIIKD